MSVSLGISKPDAVIFDWDNTLVNNWSAIHDSLMAAFDAMGHERWSFKQTLENAKKSLRDTFPDMFGDRWEEAAEVFYSHFRANHLNGLEAMPGALDLLNELKEQGVYLGIVSNKNGEFLRKESDHLGWTKLFGAVVGATDAPKDKPAVEPVHMSLEGSGVTAGQNVWFVGDADVDLECAKASGCIPILVRAKAPEEGEFNANPPTMHFRDCLEAVTLVKKLQHVL
ncbi:MAG: HAD family hydrolase [Rhodospirillales bacterium]|nr:HAD family hydrolase [Rhodospirillales bacterium]